jgi:hypothetical protein
VMRESIIFMVAGSSDFFILQMHGAIPTTSYRTPMKIAVYSYLGNN